MFLAQADTQSKWQALSNYIRLNCSHSTMKLPTRYETMWSAMSQNEMRTQ